MSYLQNNSQKDGKTKDFSLIYSIQTAKTKTHSKVLALAHLAVKTWMLFSWMSAWPLRHICHATLSQIIVTPSLDRFKTKVYLRNTHDTICTKKVLWGGILVVLSALVVEFLLLHVLVLVPFDGVFVVLDGSVSDWLECCCTGVKSIHPSQKPVTAATLLVISHVTFYPAA